MAKRKASAAALAPPAKRTPVPLPAAPSAPASKTPIPLPGSTTLNRRASSRATVKAKNVEVTDPERNGDVLDAPNALRASPDSDVNEEIAPGEVKGDETEDSPLSDVPELEVEAGKGKKGVKAGTKKGGAGAGKAAAEVKKEAVAGKERKSKKDEDEMKDPEAEDEEEADEQEIKEASMRPPPVNSAYLPLPWKGRIGYACLNTYLRNAHPPVFASRTCRLASIIEHRHPLKNPDEPEHATKNRPDRDQPADVARGQAYVEALGLANARDVIKMLRWNDRYGIKFLRLSSEMFPFASHEEYGYKLAPFAAETLAEVGKVVAELGHRVTTHPGQFTQLGSPRKQVIDNAIRDLAYHDEMLSLLKLPPQMDRDAVMILHLGGVFGDKAATIDRFRENYVKLPQSVKNRLVLENDDVCYTVHDLLPVCQELNIPLVLDFHHHNILFDSDKIREGTEDIQKLYPEITATWARKNIKQKMHYSEPTPPAITGRQRRKHNPRPFTLPPCADDMDLMIEAKDKEQAVFELMRTFKLPGFDSFADIIPHVRQDDNRPAPGANRKKATPKKKSKKADDEDVAEDVEEEAPQRIIPEDEVAMGGPEGRVYWPPGMEEWLRPAKRVIKKKEPELDKDGNVKLTPAEKRKAKAKADAEKEKASAKKVKVEADGEAAETDAKKTPVKKGRAAPVAAKKKAVKAVPTPSTSAGEDSPDEMPDLEAEEDVKPALKRRNTSTRKSGRGAAAKVSYAEADASE